MATRGNIRRVEIGSFKAAACSQFRISTEACEEHHRLTYLSADGHDLPIPYIIEWEIASVGRKLACRVTCVTV